MKGIIDFRYFDYLLVISIKITVAIEGEEFALAKTKLYSLRVRLAILYVAIQEGCSLETFNKFPDLEEIGKAIDKLEESLINFFKDIDSYNCC